MLSRAILHTSHNLERLTSCREDGDPMSGSAHTRARRSKPHVRACPLRPRKRPSVIEMHARTPVHHHATHATSAATLSACRDRRACVRVPLNSYSSSQTSIHVDKHRFTYMGKL